MFKIITKLFASDKRFLIGLILIVCLSSQGYSQVKESSDGEQVILPYSQEYLDQYNANLDKKAAEYNSTFRSRSKAEAFNNAQRGGTVGACNLITCGSFEKTDVNGGTFRTAVGGTNGQYQADARYTCWNDDGTVDWSEGQYISYSTTNSNVLYPAIIEPSTFDGGGFAIFSYQNEAIRQTLNVVPNTIYTVCFEIAVIPRYNTVNSNNQGGGVIEYAPNLQFGVRNGAVQISDPLTYTHNDLVQHPLSDFPTRLSFATNGNNGNQNPGGWTEINPYWENRCITFRSGNSATSVEVFYKTGNPGRSVVLVDGLRLSVEGYANAPTLSLTEKTYCVPTQVQLDSFVTSTTPPGAQLRWSANSDLSNPLAVNPTVTTPGIWYAFYFNPTLGCTSPSRKLTLTNTDLNSSYTKVNVTCFGGNNGSIDLSVTGGSGTYTYAWTASNGGSGLNPTAQDQSGLTAGTYNVTVNDGTCTTLETIVINQPNQINVDAGNYGPLCDQINPITLTGTPTDSNGTWTGIGVTNNGNGTASFNPTGLSGTITVTYSYTNGSGCSNSDTADIVINTTPLVDDPSDVTACDSYTLPALTHGNYFTGSRGTGTALSAGYIVETTQTIYVYAETGTTPNCTAENSFLVTINNCGIQLEKIASPNNSQGCTPIAPGESITYTFNVSNPVGNAPINNVELRDPLIDPTNNPLPGPVSGDTSNPGVLDAGETWVYTASFIITQQDIINGQVQNTATVNGLVQTTGNPYPVSTSDSVTVNLCQNAEISIVKSSVSATGDCINFEVEDTIDYKFVVTNEGDVDITDVIVNDTKLGGVIAGPAMGDVNLDGILNVGEVWTYNASYTITQFDIDFGSVVNIATVEGDTALGHRDANSNTVTVLICQSADIAIVKSSDQVPGNNGCVDLAEGDVITYTFTVTNEGNVSIDNVVVADPLVGLSAINGPTGDTGSDGILGLDEIWEYTATYTVTQSDVDAGEVTNQAAVNGLAMNPSNTPVSDDSHPTSTTADGETVVVICQNPVIAIVKTGIFNDENQNDCADVDETISYTFTVTNEGNVSLSNIIVDDPLLGGPIAGPDSGDTDGDGELDVTETWIYSGTYTITQDDIDDGEVVNQATATGTAPDQSTVSDLSGSTTTTDDETVIELCQNPAIAIVKTGIFNDENQNDCADVDETISYTFTVTNEGNVSLSNVTVTDPLIATITGPTGDTDSDGELDVTETWVFTGTYVITQDDIDLGLVKNQATAEGTAPDATVVSDLSDESSVLEDDPTIVELCQDPAIAIVKTGIFNDENQNDCADVDETISYTFTVTNEGNVSLSSVEVTDPLLGGPIAGPDSGDTDGDGELDVTETWIYTGNYSITQDDIDAGQVVNQATAKGNDPMGNPVSDLSDESSVLEDDPTIVELCQNPAIAIVKTGIFNDENQNNCADVDETISYTFTVTNEGNVSLSNVTVTDPLIATITGPTGDTDGDGELDVTETWVYTGNYAITQVDIDAGEVINQATAEGTAPDATVVTDLSDESSVLEDDPTIIELCQNPVIALIKTGVVDDTNGNGCADVGETIEYSFTVFNLGNITLSNITVTDPLVSVIGGPITLAPGITDGTSFTASYTITQADIDAGFVENQATATGTDPSGNSVSDLSDDNSEVENDPTITELCQNPAIALIKVGVPNDENGDGCADLGETILYTFSVKNTGNVALTNIIITDPLVAVVGGPIDLIAGEEDTTTFTAVYTITQADVDAGLVENQATAEGIAPNGDVVTDLSDNNSYTEDDPTIVDVCNVVSNPSISLEKTGVFNDEDGNGSANVGETISYTFTVTNTGDVTLYNIVITDPLPGIEIFGGPIAELEPGEVDSTTFTATYTINDQDIGNGEVVNQATVTGEDSEGTIVEDESDDPTDLTNTDNNGDGEPDDPTVVTLPFVLDTTFEIFNGITPNGDGLNDYFQIVGIENWPNNNVKIFNRWGVLVFETNGYGGSDGKQNVFRGISEGRVTVQQNEELPTGTYFYILTFPADNPGKADYTGYLYINR